MPALSDYTAGTITLTNGSVNFTGAGTGWQAADFREGDTILGIEDNAGVEYVIASITDNGAGTLTQEWEGATGTYTYRMRYLADGARVTAQARNLIELLGNGNLQALAGLTGPGVPVFNGPHAMTIKPEADFVNGVAYDVQVDTLADRAAYDGQSEGFAVLVSDVGDGRSALFSKASNTSGDWTDPAYVTGPVGPMPEVEATVTSLPPGSTATVAPTPITGGVRLDFELPEASGFYNAGVYDIAETYNQDDVVRHSGSSFIALQAVPAGTSPSNASPPVDTAYWQVLAAKGADGAGTGDVVGPSGAVADRIAVFDGTTGKLIKDGGKTIAELQPEGAVRYDTAQSLNSTQQGMARDNISAFGVIRVQKFTASGTYTPHPKMVFCDVEALGGGGGGGGSTTTGTNSAGAGGGGSSSYARSRLSRTEIGSSQPVTIGAGGGAGSAGNAGSSGGNTSLGTLVVSNAGSGGAGANNAPGDGGVGGTGGTGDLIIPGADGGRGTGTSVSGTYTLSGPGGGSFFGFGAAAAWAGIGKSATVPGTGGSGASAAGAASFAGGAGANGIVVITEYCSE